jgi:putative phosphoesterase
MKILVFSDSHGNIESLRKAISIHKSTTDLVIFLGDGVFDLESIKNEFSDLAFYIVRGNCDFMCADIPKDGVLDLDGVRFLICHGHTYNVKSSLDTVLYYEGIDGFACLVELALLKVEGDGGLVLTEGHVNLARFIKL